MKMENNSYYPLYSPIPESGIMSDIANDTLKGLSSDPKYLLSKYFYDDNGSIIFQEIMKMTEYYLTGCESETLIKYKEQITRAFCEGSVLANIIELGAGDGSKTRILLRTLLNEGVDFNYMPLDISRNSNDELSHRLKKEMPGVRCEPLTGDWYQSIRTLNLDRKPGIRQVILFLGSNIGNLDRIELSLFLENLSAFTRSGDKLLIGFDLKKSPKLIMDAYSDPYGLTKKFNLNHLNRINWELQADFDLNMFEHHAEYNPVTGNVKSFLVSKSKQSVFVGELGKIFRFGQWEPVFMELSRKFDIEEINVLAERHGFMVDQHFTDHRKYFVDSLWTKL